MKILLINKFLYTNGGSETYIFKLGAYLQSHGHEVQYFGMDHPERTVGNRVNAYTSGMDFHNNSVISKLTYPIKTIYSREARKKIRMVLEDFQPDVCHLNNFNYQLTPSIILEIRKWERETAHPCRIIYTAHDVQLVCPNHMMKNPCTNQICENCLGGRFLYCARGKCIHGSTAKSIIGCLEGYFWKWLGTYKKIDTIICPSHFMKSMLDTNTALANKNVVLHNFVDPVARVNTEKKDYVLYFGRYSPEKGIGTLVQAAKELAHIPFIFAGSGPLESQLKDVPNIQNVGFQTGESLERLIREARFSVYPSEWYENCPFSVIESQLFGTPVLGADIGGIPELVQTGQTGELFESGNKEALKKSISELWSNVKKTTQYAQNCNNVTCLGLEEYYQELMRFYAFN